MRLHAGPRKKQAIMHRIGCRGAEYTAAMPGGILDLFDAWVQLSTRKWPILSTLDMWQVRAGVLKTDI